LNHFVLPVNESATKKGEKGFELLDNISIHATVETGKLQYNQFLAQKTTAIVNWTGKQIQVEDFSSEAFGGKVNMDGQIENAPDGRFLISLSANLANINMNQLFKVCNNFGQTEITDKMSYFFEINADSASQKNNRFSIIFNPEKNIPYAPFVLNIQVAPNPTKDIINLYYNQPNAAESFIKIVDALGKEMYQKNLGTVSNGSFSIYTKNWDSGTYYLSFISGKQSIIRKVIKN
jgi:hypothetical protein